MSGHAIAPRCLDIALDYVAPPTLDPALLARWLVEAMAIEPASLGEPASPDPADARAVALLGHALALGRLFLELGQVPVFDVPKVLSIQRSRVRPDAFRARVRLREVALIPPRVYRHALQSALTLGAWAGCTPLDDAQRARLYAAVETKVVRPMRRWVPAGKSTIPVLRVAHAMDIPFLHLGLGVYQLGWGSKARRMHRSTTGQDSAIGARLAQDKVATAQLLRTAGLPAPVHAVVGTEPAAVAAASRIGYPVVVKPSDGERGEGVTVDVDGEAALRAAFAVAHARARARRVIVERQVRGVCHRLFIANGSLLYAVKRHPMSVQGDGRSSVAALVDAELRTQAARPTWRRTEIRPIDDLAVAAMGRDGFTPESVPAVGARVPLRRIESTEWGGVDEDVGQCIHPENLAIALRAAELFGLHVAGIDLISEDIAVPWYENGAILNEVNFAPLFGGAEISRAHIPSFLRAFLPGGGRIPVERYAGPDAERRAALRQQALAAQGLRCFRISASRTLDEDGAPVHMSLQGIDAQLQALLCRSDVDAVVVCATPA